MINLNSTVYAVHSWPIPLVTSISKILFFSSYIFVLSFIHILTIKSIILLSSLHILTINSIILLSIPISFGICTYHCFSFYWVICFLKSIAIATICSFFLYVYSTHSLRINRLSKIFPPAVNQAWSNFPILFSAMCFSISLPISDINILYGTSVIAIGLSSVSVGLFFFGIMIVFDFFHSVFPVFPLAPFSFSIALLSFISYLYSSALSASSPADLPAFNFSSTFFTSSSLISTCLLLHMDPMLFLGYLRLFLLLCLVLLFSPFLFHTWFQYSFFLFWCFWYVCFQNPSILFSASISFNYFPSSSYFLSSFF